MVSNCMSQLLSDFWCAGKLVGWLSDCLIVSDQHWGAKCLIVWPQSDVIRQNQTKSDAIRCCQTSVASDPGYYCYGQFGHLVHSLRGYTVGMIYQCSVNKRWLVIYICRSLIVQRDISRCGNLLADLCWPALLPHLALSHTPSFRGQPQQTSCALRKNTGNRNSAGM